MRTLSLRLPESLHQYAREIAEKQNISLNQRITLALAEKLSALGTEAYLEMRAKRASQEKFLAAMAKVAKVEPEDYDRL